MRDYSVLSIAAADADDRTAGIELGFLQELEHTIKTIGGSRFTVDGHPRMVAEQTRARLGDAIKELTHVQISKIADGAEKFGKKEQRVLLEVVRGDHAKRDAQLVFLESDVTAQYIFYNEEQKEDARLLLELKRIQYLQDVVMKQLEMTDRSGSTQVVQGMIAAGQKFVAGLTAVFKRVEALSKHIEKGLHNKADMPSLERKTAAMAAITKELRELPAIDPRHIAIKQLVMKQIERLQEKFTVAPTAPRATAAILPMKAPTTVPKADVKVDAKATTKAVPVVKAHVETKVDAKVEVSAEVNTALMAVQAKAEIRTSPVAPTETMRQMSATIRSIAPNVSVQQVAARLGDTSPVAVLQQAIVKELTAVPIIAVPAASTPVSTVSNGSPISIVQSVQGIAVQTMPVQTAPVQTTPIQSVAAQAHVQLQQLQQQETPKQQATIVQPISQPAQLVQITTAQPINSVQQTVPVASIQTGGVSTVAQTTALPTTQPANIQPAGVNQPAALTTAAVTTIVQNNTTTNTVAVTAQSVAQSQPARATVDATGITRNGNANLNSNTNANRTIQQTQGTTDGTDNRGVVTSEAVNKTAPAEAKKSDAAVEKNPERPATTERGQEAKGEKEADKKKEAVADSGCNTCTTKNCGACRVSSLQGNGSASVQYGNTSAQGEKDAKAQIKDNGAKCAGCGGCGPGGCSRVAADPNVVAASHNASLDKLGARRRSAPQAALRAA